MRSLFTGLTKHQAMLLLTAVTFGGREGVEAFDCLMEEEAEVLRCRAEKIMAIPREQRVPFLVQEIKRFAKSTRTDVLQSADPAHITEILSGEGAGMTEVILRALPPAIAEEVRLALAQPILELERLTRSSVLAVIRCKFEDRLASIVPRKTPLTAADLLLLPTNDLVFLADMLGVAPLAKMLPALPENEQKELLAKLLPEQRAILRQNIGPSAGQGVGLSTGQSTGQGVGQSIGSTKESEADQQRIKTLLSQTGNDPQEAVRRLGIKRIAGACLAHSAEFAARVIEKHRDEFGRKLAESVSEERQEKNFGPDSLKKVLALLGTLCDEGRIERPARPQSVSRAPAWARRTSAEAPIFRPAIQLGGAAARPSREIEAPGNRDPRK